MALRKSQRLTNKPAQRLRDARQKAGFDSAAEAARAFGWGEGTYRHHENGTRRFGRDHAAIYGRAFRVSPAWLMGFEEQQALSAFDQAHIELQHQAISPRSDEMPRVAELEDLGLMLIKEVDLRAFVGVADVSALVGRDRFQAFETSLLNNLTDGDPSGLIAIKADGNQMAPLIHRGALMLVDTRFPEVDYQDGIWLFTHFALTSIRRIRQVDSKWLEARTNDRTIEPLRMKVAETVIRGRIVWVGQSIS